MIRSFNFRNRCAAASAPASALLAADRARAPALDAELERERLPLERLELEREREPDDDERLLFEREPDDVEPDPEERLEREPPPEPPLLACGISPLLELTIDAHTTLLHAAVEAWRLQP